MRISAPRDPQFAGQVFTDAEAAAIVAPAATPLPILGLMGAANQSWEDFDRLPPSRQAQVAARLSVEAEYDVSTLMPDMIAAMPDRFFARVPATSIQLAAMMGGITPAQADAGYQRLAALFRLGLVTGVPHSEVIARLVGG